MPKPCSRFWSRRRWLRQFLVRAGVGTQTGPWRCCVFREERKFRRRFSASAPTICLPQSFPTWPPARKTSPATFKFLTGGHVGKEDRKSTRLNSSHRCISYAVFCLKKKKKRKKKILH